MSPTKILIGQGCSVVAIVVGGLWGFDAVDSSDAGQSAKIGCTAYVSAWPTDLCALAAV